MACSAVTCNSRSYIHKDLSFFRFPSDEKLKKKWIIAMRRMDPINKNKLWSPTKTNRLCSKHFRDEDFAFTSHLRKTIKPGVIPSIFELPDHLKKSNESTRRKLNRISLQPQVEPITAQPSVINIPASVPSIPNLPAHPEKSNESEQSVIEKEPAPQVEQITALPVTEKDPAQSQIEKITPVPYVIKIPTAVPSFLYLPAHPKNSSENEKVVVKPVTTEPPVYDISDDESSNLDPPTHPQKKDIEKASVQPQTGAPSIINFVIGPKEAFNNLIRNHTKVVQNLEESLKRKTAELGSKEKECLLLRAQLAKKEEIIARNRKEIKRLQSSNSYIKKHLARLQDTVIELQEKNIMLEGNIY